MSRFSPSDAALEGFRLTRERPAAMLAWSFVYFGGLLLITLTMMITLGPQFIAVVKKGGFSADDIEAVSGLLYQSGPAFILLLLMTIVLFSVITGGVLRLVLRPEEHGFAHLRLGRDELRLAAVNLVFVGFYVVSLVAGVLVGQVFSQSGAPLNVLAPAVIVGLPASWVGVRLCLMTPLTFDRRRISFGDAWAMSKGRSWSLLGMIVLAVVFYVMVWLLFFVIGLALVELSGGEKAMQDISKLTPLTAVAAIASLIMQFLMQILQVVMLYGPFAVAYRQIRGANASEVPGAPATASP
ncbi:hypothetical protein [Phenylobacterium sp.]|uniref:hypothetical protein n=1 Tax=Phenylobacterium sp. TaxID=1871053 RepID=UPI0025F06D79|nr:hypothetical protein [Phenylobacterium sp.]